MASSDEFSSRMVHNSPRLVDLSEDIVSDLSPGFLESLPRTSLSSSQYVAPYPYDVDVSTSCSPTPAGRSLSTWSRPARSVYGGVRQFLRRALREVHFSGVTNDGEFALERPKRPDKNLQALSRATQLSKEELKLFYRAFKQECPNGTAEPKHFRYILNKYFPIGDCSSYAVHLFNAFDIQRKGYLTFEELVFAISSLSRGSLSDKLSWVFHLYDTDADGIVSRQELRDVIVAVHRLAGYGYLMAGESRKVSTVSRNDTSVTVNNIFDELVNKQTDIVFQKLDLNRDGIITMEVFLQACLQDDSILSSLERLSTEI